MASSTAYSSTAHRNTAHTHTAHHSSQEVALHMIAAAARILLMLGTAILIGEVAAGPARKLLDTRSHRRSVVTEDGEPAD